MILSAFLNDRMSVALLAALLLHAFVALGIDAPRAD